jgi:hypothetical protein
MVLPKAGLRCLIQYLKFQLTFVSYLNISNSKTAHQHLPPVLLRGVVDIATSSSASFYWQC